MNSKYKNKLYLLPDEYDKVAERIHFYMENHVESETNVTQII